MYKLNLCKTDKVKFLYGYYGPSWYQELSSTQMTAANNLSNAVHEDLEQGTLHRCKQSLRGIGIKPILNKIDLKVALQLSKGNDLAFLWFLYDIFYVSHTNNGKSKIDWRYLHVLNLHF